jgi:hypothetical protein
MDGISAKFSPGDEKHKQMLDFGRNFARYLTEAK